MSDALDDTHDAGLRSWVASAQDPLADFPLQNLPLGRFRRQGSDEPLRGGVAIGDQVLDLRLAHELCPWSPEVSRAMEPLARGDLNAFIALGAAARRTLRAALSNALREGSDDEPWLQSCLVPQAQASFLDLIKQLDGSRAVQQISSDPWASKIVQGLAAYALLAR